MMGPPADELMMMFFLHSAPTVSPAEVRGNHAVDIDPIAQLQGDGHSEPAGAQPGVWYPPAEKRRRREKTVR